MQQARLRVALCTKSQIIALADPGEGPGPPPPLFLDQTKGRRVENNFLTDRPPPYLRVWMTTPPPPPTSSQGLNPVALNCALYPDMIIIVTCIQPRPPGP